MRHRPFSRLYRYLVPSFALIWMALLLFGCGGGGGDSGPAGSNTGTVSGNVMAPDGVTPLQDVKVTNNLTSNSATTDSTGKFSLSLPIGTYTLSFAKSGFTPATAPVTVAAAGSASSLTTVVLAESASGLPSVTMASDKNEVGYGNTVNLVATVTPGTNSSTFAYKWSITPPSAGSAQGLAKIAQDATDPKKAVVTMPAMYDTTAFRGAFDGTVTKIGSQIYKTMPYEQTNPKDVKGAASPAGAIIPADQNYVAKFIPQTYTGNPTVLPISPDTRASVTVKVTVTDSLGGVVNVGMPSTSPLYAAAVQTGVKDVAIGAPVYLNSGHAAPWAWTLTPPAGSAATLSSAAEQYPFFVPDVAGKYTVKEGTKTSDIWAGKFVGIIAGGTVTTKTFNLNNELDREKSGMWYDTTATAYWAAGATSATYTNWPVVTPDSGCAACHATGAVVDGLTAVDNITPWVGTAHATFFARGIEGITGNSGTCLTCHSAGYDLSVGANNGGFDNVATATSWTYPSTRKAGNWADFTSKYPKVARLSNIQCENCHGPQDTVSGGGTGAHISGVKGATRGDGSTVAGGTRVNFSSEVCAACHASGTGHHIYSEWATLSEGGKGHSYLPLAQSRYNCACHSAQAFAQFIPQLKSGIVEYDILVSNPTAVTWSAADAQPQTCTACHDPHDATNPMQLRIYNDTPILPAGFKVTGLGKGALCMTCHNARGGQQCNGTVITSEPANGLPASAPLAKGQTTATLLTANACAVATAGDPQRSQTLTFLHEDGDAYQIANPTYGGVHDATQADVLLGRNAFFMGNSLPMTSKHAAVKDSCVGCHMVLNPTTHLSHGAAATSTHTFGIPEARKNELCANCHSANVSADGIQANVEALLEALWNEMANYMKTRMNAAIGGGTTLAWRKGSGTAADPYVYTPFTTIGAVGRPKNSNGTVNYNSANVILFNAAGTTMQGNITASSPYPSFSGTSVYYLDTVNNVYKFFFTSTDPAVGNKLYKANQNYLLIYRDGSEGVHNQTFVTQVLNNSIAQMKNTSN